MLRIREQPDFEDHNVEFWPAVDQWNGSRTTGGELWQTFGKGPRANAQH